LSICKRDNESAKLFLTPGTCFAENYTGKWFSSAWSEDLPLVSDKTLSIAFLELYPIVISAILWGKDWKCKNILFWCDNEATVGI
jgi:hypothetical protein